MFAIQRAYRQGGLARSQWSNNIIAGLVVGVVALPLAMAFAIASGVTPQAGIYTAIIAVYSCLFLGVLKYRLQALRVHLLSCLAV